MKKGSGKRTKTGPQDSDQHPAPDKDKSPVAGIAAFGHDSTGRKEAPEALRERESVLRSFFDSSGVMRGIVEVVAEDDLRHIADNAATAAFIGLTPEAMKNRCGSELGEPRDILRMWIGHYKKSQKSKKPVSFEYMDRRGETGSWLLATVSYLGTPPRGYPRFAYVIIDITERKRAEEALREAQDRATAILEGIADTFYSLDEDWRFTLVNPAAEKAPFGRPAVELLGRVIWDLYPNLVGTRIHRHYLDAMEKLTLEHYEARSPLDGRWYEVFMKGRKGGVDVYMRDITARKLAEERAERLFSEVKREKDRLSALISSISDEIWFADTSKKFVLANPSALREFGLTSENQLDVEKFAADLEVFRPDGNLRPVEEAPPLRALYGEIIKNQEEIVRTPGSGDLRYRQVSASPVRDEEGSIIGSVSVVRDITEQKQAEEALLKARDELEIHVDERTAELNEAIQALGTERLRLFDVLETLPVYVCLLDRDYRMPFVNRYFRETFGTTEGRRCYEALFSRTEPCETCETYTVMKTRAPHHWFWTGPNGRDYDIYDFPFTDTDGSFMILEMGIDITERKKAEEEWAILASIVEHSEDAIVGKSLSGIIMSWNAGAEKMYGYSAEDAIGRHMSMLVPPGQEDDIDYIQDRIRKGEPVFHFDTIRIRKDGVPIQVSLTVSPIKDHKGSLIGASTIARDISIRKKAEAAIEKAGAYNRSLIEASLDPLVTISPDGTISDVNEATIRVTGFSREELVGTDFSDYFTEPAMAKAGYVKAFRDGLVTDYGLEIRHKDGHVTPVLYNATVYRDTAGRVTGVFASARDITERKKAEEDLQRAHDLLEERVKERTAELAGMNVHLTDEISQRRLAESLVKKTLSELQAAIESTADGIYAVDLAGRIIRYNENFASMWKIPDGLLQTRDDARVSEFLQSQVKNSGLFTDKDDAELRHRDRETYDMLELKDGRIFERYSKPQKMDASIIGRVMSYRDVTDRRRAEERLIASLQEKETLIREIHHRVKNNLQIISGLLDMTRMRTPDSMTNSILTDMMMKIKTMAQIHTRLYESKQFDRINMGSQIRDQVADLSSIYGRSGAEIQSEIDAQDIYLPVDQAIPCALVVNEILSNAFKHAFKGRRHGSLMVSATQSDDHIRITVHDDGVGIPKDVDVSRTTSLGLKLIRSLVLQLGGSVTVSSNHGTEVMVEFPLNAGGK